MAGDDALDALLLHRIQMAGDAVQVDGVSSSENLFRPLEMDQVVLVGVFPETFESVVDLDAVCLEAVDKQADKGVLVGAVDVLLDEEYFHTDGFSRWFRVVPRG